MNYSEYKAEMKSIAFNLVEANQEKEDSEFNVFDHIRDNGLDHEAVDGHQWSIYYSYSLDIIKHSDNDEYMVDNLGDESLVHALKEGGLNGLHQAIAFYAMVADVNEELSTLEQEIE